jgi:hypothetical protein
MTEVSELRLGIEAVEDLFGTLKACGPTPRAFSHHIDGRL